MDFAQAFEDLSWNHCTSTPHRSETNGIAERAVRRVKEGTSAVLLQSGLNENWWTHSMEYYTYLRNVEDLWSDGKTPCERYFRAIIKKTILHLVHWLNITLYLRKTNQGSINLERKSYLHCSSDMQCTRVEFRRVTYWSQTSKNWRRWTHRKSTRKDSMRKRWYFPSKENLLFQSQMDESKPLGGDQDLRTSTLIRQGPIRGESNIHFLGESEVSLPYPHDSVPDASEAIDDLWSMSGNFKDHHHVEPRVKLCSPKNHSLFHWNTLTCPELHNNYS